MKHKTSLVKCSCGRSLPSRWVDEGKVVINKAAESYCVRCADDTQYNDLVNRFAQYMKDIKTH